MTLLRAKLTHYMYQVAVAVRKAPDQPASHAPEWKDKIGYYLLEDPESPLSEPRVVYCRILRSKTVMVRIGGGWQELASFITQHFTGEVDISVTDTPRGNGRGQKLSTSKVEDDILQANSLILSQDTLSPTPRHRVRSRVTSMPGSAAPSPPRRPSPAGIVRPQSVAATVRQPSTPTPRLGSGHIITSSLGRASGRASMPPERGTQGLRITTEPFGRIGIPSAFQESPSSRTRIPTPMRNRITTPMRNRIPTPMRNRLLQPSSSQSRQQSTTTTTTSTLTSTSTASADSPSRSPNAQSRIPRLTSPPLFRP